MKRILLLCMFLSFGLYVGAWAQGRTVTGTVTSESGGEPAPGVNVVLKGTSTGTVTDVNGEYSIQVPEEGGTLVFSFIGMKTEEVAVGDRSVINVAIASDTKQLSEIVVTGYGVERPSNELTYQTDKVEAQTLVQGQQQIAAAGLTGKVAGLQINVQNNGVNPEAQILLRGLRSISKNNEALIVIDGGIASTGAFNDLNPNDIESIDILKGANAAALYGSKAANGAVIVTTKKGQKNEKFTVGLNSSYTFEEVAYLPDFQTEHGSGWDGSYDPIENTNWGPRFDGVTRRIGPDFPDDYVLDDQMVPYAPLKGNLRDFYQTGSTFQNTVYFSGGDETSSFYLSYGRVDTKGIVPDDKYNKNSFRINANKSLGKLSLGVNASYIQDETDIVADNIGDQDRTLYWFVLNTPANIPLSSYKDWDNPQSYGYADNYYNAYYENPYWAIGTNRNTDETNRLVGNIKASYDILENVNLTGRLAINRNTGTGKEWRDAQDFDPDLQPSHSAVSSYLEDYEFQSNDINGNILLSGEFSFADDFSLKPILGASFISSKYRESTVTANNLSIPGFYDISNGTGQLQGVVDQSEKRTYGFFADITLGYRGWAYLNFAGRQDYTSTLPEDNNGYFYPAASLSFIPTELFSSITDNGILSFAKLTVSNATVYNDLSAYELNERYRSPDISPTAEEELPFPFGNVNAFEKSRVTVDPGIQKEKLNTWEFGANLGFLDDRFYVDGSYFMTTTTNLITSTTPSYSSGATRYLTNIGELSSKGYEITLGGKLLKVGDFSWDFNVNYSSNETIVEEIKEDLKEVALDVYTGGYGTYAIVGKAFPQIKAQSYVRDGQGRVVIDPATGNPIVGDVLPHGKATPDYIIGATSQLSYKGISISATVDYRTGHVFYSQGADQMEFTGRSKESVSSDRQDFVWPNSVIETSEGEYVKNTNIPVSGGRMGFWQNTYNVIKENYVKDATAFKIRELSVNYTLPRSIVSKTGVLNKLTVGFLARNLLTVLPEENRFSDPEFKNTRSTDDPNGIGIGGYFQSPPTRSFGFNLNVEF